MADSEDEDGSLNLTGFLFGNINEKGELEDTEILDEESRRHLSQLNSLSGLGSLVQDIAEEGNSQSQDSTSLSEPNSNWIQKDSSATDYSDITELAEEEEEKYYKHAVSIFAQKKSTSSADDDYDDDNESVDNAQSNGQASSILLPTVAPAASTLSKQEQDRLAMPPPPAPQLSASPSAEGTRDGVDGDKGSLAAPLAGTVGSELPSKEGKLTTHDGKTVTDLFPEFRPGQVLRFSRLFGPAKASSMPQQWRNAKKRKKKKKKQGEDEKAILEPPKSPPSPRPEDCMSDDEDKLMAPWEPTADELRDVNGDGNSSGSQDNNRKQMCEWRNGPAALWYEMLGVNEDGTNLDYGFKLKEARP